MKYSRVVAPLVLGACLVTAISCGNSDDDDSSNSQPQQEQEADLGSFSATLNTLNPGVGGNAAAGTATARIVGDEIEISLNMTGTPARITHVQHIHAASACPTMARDVNGDGFLDVVEGIPDYGPILVPLDGNINSQSAGASVNPTADSSGSYEYSETGSLRRMLEDLYEPDADTTDATIKLPAGTDLNLEGRHFVVHGVPSSTDLPDTVATIHDLPNEATLPIACGTIRRIADGGTGTTTGGTGTTTGGTGTTTGGTGTTTGGTGTTTGGTGTTTGGTGSTTGHSSGH